MERGRATGSRGHATIAELCRRKGIAQSLYDSGSKEFLGEARAAIGPRPLASATLDIALAASGCNSARVLHKLWLLSGLPMVAPLVRATIGDGSSCIAEDLAKYLGGKGMKHVRGAPMHPQSQGKIERWHQTLKNRILLENHFLEGELEAAIAAFIDHSNNHRCHVSIGNLTPADVCFGHGDTILAERRRITLKTIQNRHLNHQRQAA